MKLSEKTINILKNFSQINPSIYVKGQTVLETISPSKSVAAKAFCEENFETPFAIYDLSRFLGTLSLFNNPDIDFQEKSAFITDGKSSVAYRYTNPSMLVYPKKTMGDLDAVVEFKLSEADLTSLMKAAGILGTPDIAIYGKDGDITMKALDSKDLSGDEFILVVGQTDEDFEVFIKTENFKFITAEYDVVVAEVATQFKSETATYWVANEFNSKI